MKQRLKKTKQAGSHIHVGAPVLHMAEPPRATVFFFYYLLLFLGMAGAFGCLYTAFSIPVSLTLLGVCALALSFIFTAIFLAPKRRVLWAFIALGVFAVAAAFLWSDIADGAVSTINFVIEAYSLNPQVNFASIPVSADAVANAAFSCTVFAVFLLYAICFLTAWLLIRGHSVFACFVVTLPFLAVSIAFTIIPNYAAITCLLLFWAFLYMNAQPLGRAGRTTPIKADSYVGSSTAVTRPAAFALLVIFVACMGIVGYFNPREGYVRSREITQVRDDLLHTGDVFSLFSGTGIGGRNGDINLQYVGNLRYDEIPILRVRANNPNRDYLRGYVGSVYTGQSWEQLPGQDLAELEPVTQDYAVQNYASLYAGANLLNRLGTLEYKVTIDNVNANPRSVYAPYGLVSSPGEMEGVVFTEDSILKSENDLTGIKEYSFTAMQFIDPYNATSHSISFNSGSRGVLSSVEGGFYPIRLDGGDIIFADSPQLFPIEGFQTGDGAEFLYTAQEYNDFVYEHYLQIPDHLRPTLEQYVADRGLYPENFHSLYQYANEVAYYLQAENTYTRYPETMPQGSDFVEYFLTENRRGYCMHFAAAAVMILRTAGVPARYAEGYPLPPQDPESDSEWVDILDSNAHAWPEIYVSGLGWVPLEVTPGESDEPVPYEVAQQGPAREQAPEQQEAESATAPPAATATPETGGTTTTGAKVSVDPLLLAMAIAVSVIAFIAILVINRTLRRRKRRAAFSDADNNAAAIAIYGYLSRLAKISLGMDESAIPEEIRGIALKARFSPHIPADGEVARMRQYTGVFMAGVRRELPWPRRLYHKYFTALID